MDVKVFWVALSVILLLGAMVVAAAVIYANSERQGRSACPVSAAWYVEMWNIRDGYQVQLQFVNTCILGRMLIYECIVNKFPARSDPTISREHCMLYEQNGMLYVSNLSAVNPAVINGYRLNIPRELMPGDRLELGNSVFMVTRVEHI